ncbi:bactofilin family protein [Sphingomonas immobilis]|uniref:Polymer-forming cytoskeletal protein n=1 Tax=Sphingomonas immobilis TaxID=3063997 RepID=A0ABT9A3I5_9SPHN|nr:polymer-forming cytoskeletal protein [Sphingomonas sp. CA1-15]MDO7844409.1 polymer-forming cytoskeletal protein [Sphingomonas sp. CA1-15]
MAIFSGNGREAANGTGAVTPVPEPAYQPPAPATKRSAFSVLGPDIVITGSISATADLHVDGRIEGDVDCACLVQGPQSSIKGAIKAEKARLAGRIEGSVRARHLTIERAARIDGDVEYEAIAIETGASINGRLKHLAQEVIPGPSPKPLVLSTVAPEDDVAA